MSPPKSPRLTRAAPLLALIALLLALPAAASACPDGPQDAIRCLINKQRDKHGAKKLRQRDSLEAAAQYHASDMAARGYFSHNSPDGSSSFDRAVRFGYLGSGGSGGVGEVIAEGSGSYGPADAVHGWLASGSHRGVVLDRQFRHIGVGVAVVNGTVWYSVDFGFR